MSLSQLLLILRARSGLILAITGMAVAIGLAVTLLLPKQYVAVASVVIDPKGFDLLSARAPVISESQDNVVATQLDIVGSPNVARKVVDDLGLEQNPEALELLRAPGVLGRIKERLVGLLPGEGGDERHSMGDWMADRLLPSMLMGLLPREESDERRSVKDWMADRLLRNIHLKTSRDSRLIKISYGSKDPAFSAAVANAFVKAYMDTTLQLRVQPAKQSTQWFDAQTQELKQTVEQAQERLAKFQQEKGIVATDERVDVENARLAELSSQLIGAQSQSYDSQAKQQQIRDFLAKGAPLSQAPPEVLTSPVVQQLRQEIAQRQAKLSENSRRIGKNHPQYKAEVAELQHLRGELSREMRDVAQGLLTGSNLAGQREASLRGALEQQRSKVLKLKGTREELAMLMRDVENAQRTYSDALQRFTQIKMESQINQSNVSVVDSATVPMRPASPRASMNLGIALICGLVIGVGVALYGETVDRHVRTGQDLVESLGVPLLAVLLPDVWKKQNVRRLRGENVYSLPRL